jgi:hypothetical protein
MTDKWDEHLRCPQCRNAGMASLSHFKGADTLTVDFVTADFKAMQTEYGSDFNAGPATSQPQLGCRAGPAVDLLSR